MKQVFLPMLVGLALASCGDAADAPDVTAPAPASAVAQETVAQTAPLTVEQSCREAVRILYGQEGEGVVFDESDFSISWPAPVDGGRLTFACSFVGSQVSLSHDGKTQTVDVSFPAVAPAQQEAR